MVLRPNIFRFVMHRQCHPLMCLDIHSGQLQRSGLSVEIPGVTHWPPSVCHEEQSNCHIYHKGFSPPASWKCNAVIKEHKYFKRVINGCPWAVSEVPALLREEFDLINKSGIHTILVISYNSNKLWIQLLGSGLIKQYYCHIVPKLIGIWEQKQDEIDLACK